jgi:hypothetical protein
VFTLFLYTFFFFCTGAGEEDLDESLSEDELLLLGELLLPCPVLLKIEARETFVENFTSGSRLRPLGSILLLSRADGT